MSVACLANTSAVPTTVLARRAATLWLGLEDPSATGPPSESGAADSSEHSADPAFEGSFLSPDADMILTVQLNGDRPAIGFGAMQIPVQVSSPTTLVGPAGTELRLTEAAIELVAPGAPEPARYSRIEPGEPPSGIAGRYRSAELDVTITVTEEEGSLKVAWPRGRHLELRHVGGEIFVASQSLMGMGLQVPVRAVAPQGRVAALELGTGRALANRFDRLETAAD